MNSLSDQGQALWAVPTGVQPRHVGQQHLRGADVGGGLLAANVLLARLECKAKCGPSLGVGADADESAGKCPGHRLAGCNEGGMRATEPHRHAETLRRTDGNVGAQLARGSGEHAGQQIGGDDHDCPAGVCPLDGRSPIRNGTG